MKRYKLFDSEEQLVQTIPVGERKMLRIGERRVCLFHLSNGFKVFDNLCPHNGHSLFEGIVNGLGEVVCPLHGYRYALLDGKECSARTRDLNIHRIEIGANGVFLLLTS